MYHPASMFISSVLISTDVLTRKFLLYDINSSCELSTIWSVCYVIPLFYCAILLMCFIHILFSLYNSYSYVSSKLDFSLAQRWCLFNVIWIFSLYPESASCSTVQYTEKKTLMHILPLWCGYGRRLTCPREVSSVPPSGQSPESVLPDAGLLYRSLQGHIPQSEPAALQPLKACLHWCTYSTSKQSKKQSMSNTTVASIPLKQAVYTFKGMKASDY